MGSPNILLHYPNWGNRWIDAITNELSVYNLRVTHTRNQKELAELSERADILFSMWCNEITAFWSNEFSKKKIISYLRRYEMWEIKLSNLISFGNIDALIFVSDFYKKFFENRWQKHAANGLNLKTYLIPNGIDLKLFPLKKSCGKKKIAFVGQMKHVKNFPLALQVLFGLPEEYTLHHIGLSATRQIVGQIISYTRNLGLENRVFFYDSVGRKEMPGWYKDKDFILSTSINEGNPNCVIEAMGMGVKPVIHAWPGARDQFPDDLVFETIQEAINIITGKHEPERYRNWVKDSFSIHNFKEIHTVIEQVMSTVSE